MEEANLVVITQDFDNIKMPITDVIGLFTSVGFQIKQVKLLNQDFLLEDLSILLGANSIILTSFDNEVCLQNIRTVLDNDIGGIYQYLKFCYFTANQNKRCFIVNDKLPNIKNCIDYEKLRLIVGETQLFNIKLFVGDQNQVLRTIRQLPNSQQFNLSWFYDCGDMWLTFVYKSADERFLNSYKQELYRQLGDYIYNDEPMTLQNSLQELLAIQGKFVVVRDNTQQKILTEYLMSKVLSERVILDENLASDVAGIRAYLADKNYRLAVSIDDDNMGQKLTFIDEVNCKTELFEYKNIQKNDKKYLIHYFLYNILQKIRKNTW